MYNYFKLSSGALPPSSSFNFIALIASSNASFLEPQLILWVLHSCTFLFLVLFFIKDLAVLILSNNFYSLASSYLFLLSVRFVGSTNLSSSIWQMDTSWLTSLFLNTYLLHFYFLKLCSSAYELAKPPYFLCLFYWLEHSSWCLRVVLLSRKEAPFSMLNAPVTSNDERRWPGG